MATEGSQLKYKYMRQQSIVGCFPNSKSDLTAMAVHPVDNEIFICDIFLNMIHVVDMNGKCLRSIGDKGCGPGKFKSPRGIAFCGSEKIVVSDCDNYRIQVLKVTGEFILQFGQFGEKDEGDDFLDPMGIAIDQDQQIYVCDFNRIKIFTINGQYKDVITHKNIKRLWGVALHNDCVFTSDDIGRCVWQFGPNRQLQHRFSLQDYVHKPRNFSIDSRGYMLVPDRSTGKIRVFDVENSDEHIRSYHTIVNDGSPRDVVILPNEQMIAVCGHVSLKFFSA